MIDPELIVLECEEHMTKTLDHLKHELKGVRTGRASTALLEYVKVEYFGSPTDLRSIAALSVPEPTQILIKPFDPSAMSEIIKAIEKADLGLNPRPEGKQLRVPIPPLSGDRRQKLASQVKQMGENAKIAIRNARRDANKHADMAEKDKSLGVSEDQIKKMKEDIQDLTKKFETEAEHLVDEKTREIMQV